VESVRRRTIEPNSRAEHVALVMLVAARLGRANQVERAGDHKGPIDVGEAAVRPCESKHCLQAAERRLDSRACGRLAQSSQVVYFYWLYRRDSPHWTVFATRSPAKRRRPGIGYVKACRGRDRACSCRVAHCPEPAASEPGRYKLSLRRPCRVSRMSSLHRLCYARAGTQRGVVT
jgi:hypothetical protein